MSRISVRARITICLLSCLVTLAGCQDASGLVAPDVKPSFLDGSYTGYTETWFEEELIWIVPGGGNPQNVYVTEPNTETISGVADAGQSYHRVYVVCMDVGVVWVKVFTGNGYWKIYEITCVAGRPPVPV